MTCSRYCLLITWAKYTMMITIMMTIMATQSHRVKLLCYTPYTNVRSKDQCDYWYTRCCWLRCWYMHYCTAKSAVTRLWTWQTTNTFVPIGRRICWWLICWIRCNNEQTWHVTILASSSAWFTWRDISVTWSLRTTIHIQSARQRLKIRLSVMAHFVSRLSFEKLS